MANITQGLIPGRPIGKLLHSDTLTTRIHDTVLQALNPVLTQLSNTPSYIAPAVGDGMADDTNGIQNALNNNAYVTLPAGNYKVAGLNIPKNTILQLLPGATIFTSASILVDASNAQLIGPSIGIVNFTTGGNSASIQWAGADGGTVIVFARSGIATAAIRGISVWSSSHANMTAMAIGNASAGGGGGSSCGVQDFTAYEFKNGIIIDGGLQTSWFKNIHLQNQNNGNGSNPYPGSVGIKVNGNAATSGVTALKFNIGLIQGYETSIWCGSATNNSIGGADCRFTDFVLEDLPFSNGCAMRVLSGGPYRFDHCEVEGPGGAGPTGTTRAIIVGAAATVVPISTRFVACDMHGFNSGTTIELFSFDGLIFLGNEIDYTGSAICISNVHSGVRSVHGTWLANYATGTAGEPDFHGDDTTGFSMADTRNIANDPANPANKAWAVWQRPSFILSNIANNTNAFIGTGRIRGTCTLIQLTGQYTTATVVFEGTNHNVWIVAVTGGSGSQFWTSTVGNAGTSNVYWDAGTSSYRIENQTGTSKTYSFSLMGQQTV